MPIIINPSEKQSQSEFAKLLEKAQASHKVEEGGIVSGKIVKLTDDYVVVDIGFKSEGQIPISEFRNEKGELTVQAGDAVEVLLERLEDDRGMVGLSKERADALKAWDSLVKIQEEGGIVEGVVLAKVKGGLFVDVGVKAFLPGSQIDVRPVRSLDKFIGKRLKFKIIKLNKKRGNIVLSRKELLAQEQGSLKETMVANIKEGEVMEGTVKNITDYGAFVDLGGFDGLLHVTDMSWGRVGHPTDLFQINDPIRVVVLKVDEATGRVSLGFKQLQEDPWQQAEGKYLVGSKIRGKVVSLADYGAFVELSPGVEGLVHISEISWNKKMKHPSQELQAGQEVEAIILDCDWDGRRIALGMKQLKPNPWDLLEKDFPVGSKVTGTIRNITDFGVFLDCGVGVDGLVHISDLAWVQNFEKPQDLFAKGESLEAVVVNIDRDGERFSLSRKQLLPNPWDTIRQGYAVGTETTGKVVGVLAGGAVIALDDGTEGFIPKSSLTKEVTKGLALDLAVAVVDEEGRKFQLKVK